MNMDADMLVAYKAAAQTVLCLRTCGGTVALSCFQICTPAKAMISTPNRTKNAMIRPSFHGYWDPPHCSARRTQMTAGRSKAVPRTSNSLSRFFHSTALPGVYWPGLVKKKEIKTAATSPKGRLI